MDGRPWPTNGEPRQSGGGMQWRFDGAGRKPTYVLMCEGWDGLVSFVKIQSGWFGLAHQLLPSKCAPLKVKTTRACINIFQ